MKTNDQETIPMFDLSERPNQCIYCDAPIPPHWVGDHFPLPRHIGGTTTVPCCETCHRIKDTISLEDWPSQWFGPIIQVWFSLPREARLFLGRVTRIIAEMDHQKQHTGSYLAQKGKSGPG